MNGVVTPLCSPVKAPRPAAQSAVASPQKAGSPDSKRLAKGSIPGSASIMKPLPRVVLQPSSSLNIRSSSTCTAASGSHQSASRELWELQSYAPPAGKISLIIGPMFAGKTTELIKRVRDEQRQGKKVAVIKSHRDTRYSDKAVVSHNKDTVDSYPVETLQQFKALISEQQFGDYDVIAIDEGQFFPDLFEFAREAADKHGKTVYVAGLAEDYRRKQFGDVLSLVLHADEVTRLGNKCQFCSRRAVFTLRHKADARQELVGGADMYSPVCREHYTKLFRDWSVSPERS